MRLEQIRKDKIEEMIGRIQSAMYAQYIGGNTVVVKNFSSIEGIIFSNDEIRFIENEGVMDFFNNEGWEVTILTARDDETHCQSDFEVLANTRFIFKPIER
jgi:hypothetical protein